MTQTKDVLHEAILKAIESSMPSFTENVSDAQVGYSYTKAERNGRSIEIPSTPNIPIFSQITL
jgi:hypothetical protein